MKQESFYVGDEIAAEIVKRVNTQIRNKQLESKTKSYQAAMTCEVQNRILRCNDKPDVATA